MLGILGVRMPIDNQEISRDEAPLGGHKSCWLAGFATEPHRLKRRTFIIGRERLCHIENTLLMSRDVSHDQHLSISTVSMMNQKPISFL